MARGGTRRRGGSMLEDAMPNNAALREVDEGRDESAEIDAPPEVNDDEFENNEANDLNNPDVTHLGDSPRVGGARGRMSDLFGEEAESAVGRSTSPRLYAQAAQFPTCAQLRVWRWENGIPVGLGTIDSTATEEDFVRQFLTAMPKRAEGRAQFKLRPIDIRGQELGQEVTIVISEHHSTLRMMREAAAEEREMRDRGVPFPLPQPSGTDMGGEMSRMVEHMLATAEQRARALEESLEMERDRMRSEELRRTQERVDLATNAAQGVQSVTDRLMKDESQRAERAMRMQQEQGQLLVTTLTSIFSQQMSMQQQASESARRSDEMRLEQERQRADRERRDAEDKRKGEREEWDAKRKRDQEENDYRLRVEREEAERKIGRERDELERRERREKDEREARERWFSEERARREEREARESREREDARSRRESLEREELKERDSERQRQHDLRVKEMEIAAAREREHQLRLLELSKVQEAAKGGDVLSSAATMMAKFGIAPDQFLPRLFGITPGGVEEKAEDDKPSPWMAMIPAVVGALSEVARASAQAKGQEGPVPPPQARQRPQIPPPAQRNENPYGQPPPRRERERVFSPPAPEEGVPAPVQEAAPPAPPAPPPEPPKKSLSEIAAEAGLQLKGQKAARVALRTLVRQLDSAPEEKWEELIVMALTSEFTIYHYIRAITVKAAMLEAGAAPELVTRVISAMHKSTMVPSDLPYGDNE